jgi:hypothetical protein
LSAVRRHGKISSLLLDMMGLLVHVLKPKNFYCCDEEFAPHQ